MHQHVDEMPAKPTAPADEASQTPVPTDAVQVFHDLMRIMRTLRSVGLQGSLASGATSALWTLVQNKPMRLSDLAEREIVAIPTMSRIVASLEKQNYVSRSPDPDDGRACLLEATPEAVELITGTTSRRAQLINSALDELDPDERAATMRCLDHLAKALTTVSA
ncbi:hypothetical protein GCM10027169_36350 [Gordonia jinhuaensis]|uniref:HTH marR-type domain-containing protein n=1 Tax=Gordonia jinhuaensis TaxID=1517702 RepID=A0A916T2G4_9ACTN|nr:hypothetical protein GCM10011489_16790 [Gordonia jinhuaensis]